MSASISARDFFSRCKKPNDDVGDLHAGVVDVVLNVHFPAGKSQQADKRVAEDGVAQMADVGSLVGIDAGMLDQNLPRWNCGVWGFASGQSGGKAGRA